MVSAVPTQSTGSTNNVPVADERRTVIHGDARERSCFREAQRAAERDSKFLVESKRSRWLPSTRSPPADGGAAGVKSARASSRRALASPCVVHAFARARLFKSTLQVRIRSRRREIDLTAQHLAPFSRVTRPYRRRAVLVAARPGRQPFGISSFCRFAPSGNLTTISLSSSPLQAGRRGLVVRASDVDDELAAVSAAVEVRRLKSRLALLTRRAFVDRSRAPRREALFTPAT